MDIGLIIGKVLLGIFGLFCVGVFGFLLYIFFKRLKVFVGVKPKESQTITPKKKEDVKGSFCSKCGIQLGEKVSFCSKCGGKVK